ncbi:stage 0 sporulation family protein [Deinococcus sp. Marseille-Q6407]|uniref:PSP1 domain-containing protein n=1 Tax=Deinococcus sp. Marseille-Q6407 TaxID=2969223 RepID=UPI0021BFF909|nr:regulatory iron-sulfur-containing complex subunit RicT [Deinococcus sp. Marseille-Q6407]
MQLVRYPRSPALHAVISEQSYPSGTPVVVQGQRGPELASARGEAAPDSPHAAQAPSGEILRAATPEDLAQAARLSALAEDIKWALRAQARALRLAVKIVSLEFTLDEALLTLSYSAEDRLDLRGLIAEVRQYTPARVNFTAVGAREQAVVLGAIGACGRENCSSRFLQELPPITIRMARDQQLPLNPDKLSGPCGRLMCCLQYEHPMYLELLRDLPRRGTRACHTESGACGKVTKLHPLAGQVDLVTENGMLENVPAAELQVQRGRSKRGEQTHD